MTQGSGHVAERSVSPPPLPGPGSFSTDLLSAQPGGGSTRQSSGPRKLRGSNSSESFGWEPMPASSHTLTPTKSQQPFMSPTKTPTKPILKNSPSLQLSPSLQGRAVQTPQKSPRVTFDMDPRHRDARTPSPRGERVVKTPDSMDKWRRRKRRWTRDGSKSPLSSSSAEGSLSDLFSQQGSSGSDVSDSAVSHKARVSVLPFEQGANKEEPTGGASGLSARFLSFASRKRSAAFSETGDTSSPSKKRKTNSSAAGGISKPAAFSEDAMDSYGLNATDSYFSASNDDVFLGSSEELIAFSSPRKVELDKGSGVASKQGSLQFKVKPRSKVGLMRCESILVFEGSQGFEIVTTQESAPPSSPIFSTSPAPKQQAKDDTQSSFGRTSSRNSSQANLSANKGKTSIRLKTLPKTRESQDQKCTPKEAEKAGPSRAASEWLTPTRSAQATHVDGGGLTPLRVKGTPTDRKYSPTVSTNSLMQLMNSPILLEDPRLPQGRLSRDGLSSGRDRSPDERPRRKPKAMPQFVD